MSDFQAQAGETLDLLAGDWRILQLRAGHRFSTDDMVTAWLASRARPGARRLLDLGAGIGSVGLMTLWCVGHRVRGQLDGDGGGVPRWSARGGPPPTLMMVEAQEVSHQLARRTVVGNGLQDRVRLRHGDLRDPAMLPREEHGTYDLVTGSPPYIPVGKGHISPHPQRAACRMELRGDVFDYCRTAASALAPGGRFALVHAAGDDRPEPAFADAGLCLLHRQDVVFRRGRPATIAVFLAGPAGAGERRDLPPLVVREADGRWTRQWRALRLQMGVTVRPERAPAGVLSASGSDAPAPGASGG
ncbi:MAG: SAM-dependent methyltransferase [Alphaproteobacteria bacterium]|nr:SAM-dependent methyltransferase [Alphaproteobacteria bacterium]